MNKRIKKKKLQELKDAFNADLKPASPYRIKQRRTASRTAKPKGYWNVIHWNARRKASIATMQETIVAGRRKRTNGQYLWRRASASRARRQYASPVGISA